MSLSKIAKPQYVLVICEKPDAARRIAEALGTSSFERISGLDKIEGRRRELLLPIFSATAGNGRHFIVCSALGHLYELVDVKGNRTNYPVFDVKWTPILKKRNSTGLKRDVKSERIIKAISLLSRKAASFVHACDYDQEGEVIGYNILQYACNNRYDNSLRAKFSTLTNEEITNSFDNLLKPSKGLAEAGRSRHVIDFIYGVNLSRALTQSFKVSNDGKRYRNLTMGRVQGPALAFVVDKETDIRKHIPVPYWTISAEFKKNEYIIKTHYYQQKVTTLSKATSIVDACTNQEGKITEINHQNVRLTAPNPFNLGDLQREAYRVFKFSPSFTLSIGEKLYVNALISYPRTSSQKLPASINYKKIISGLSKIDSLAAGNNNKNSNSTTFTYSKQTINLLSKQCLFPNEGSKIDPAHPAIYPTGEKPKGRLETAELKLFDLIIRRFLATFGDPAISELITATILVNDGDHIFRSDEKKIIDEGWMYFYKPYINRTGLASAQTLLPDLRIGDILRNIGITMDEKFTQPPARYNQASLLEKMEKEKIGTKATRSDIINTLFNRNYITSTTFYQKENNTGGGGIEATDIGFAIIQSMRKYLPNIVSIDLTRSMEQQLEKIESHKTSSRHVIEYAKGKLKEAIVPFKQNEIEIGRQITDAVIITKNKQQIILGPCPVCGYGDLKIISSNATKKRFVGCSNYALGKCKATAPLPQKGQIKNTSKSCSVCRWPVVSIVYRPQTKCHWKFCINMQCPSKRSQ
ncbi:MAG TPA: DNA topoisomerase I [Nitrososphaeraceae archaeon]|nr:DNA topoisomerase I [Nitrososphaeraceae archaeon]